MNSPRVGIAGEGVHRIEHARAHQERADQAEREREHGEQHRPARKRVALFDHDRMDQRGRDQPRHQRGVLHRIPEPEAAPAELVIGPPGAARRCRA